MAPSLLILSHTSEVDHADADLLVTDLVHHAVAADVDAQQVGAAERAVRPGGVGEVVDGGEYLPDSVGVVFGEPLGLGEGFGLLDDLVAHASAPPNTRR